MRKLRRRNSGDLPFRTVHPVARGASGGRDSGSTLTAASLPARIEGTTGLGGVTGSSLTQTRLAEGDSGSSLILTCLLGVSKAAGGANDSFRGGEMVRECAARAHTLHIVRGSSVAGRNARSKCLANLEAWCFSSTYRRRSMRELMRAAETAVLAR